MSACSAPSRSSARSEPRAARWAALPLILAAPLALQDEPAGELSGLMNELSRAFCELELRAAEGDLPRLAAGAGELRGLLGDRAGHARGGEGAEEELAPRFARLDAAAAELSELAARGELLAAGQAFEDLRASCVSCHALHRPGNDVRGSFPARDNTVTGTVELLDADGRPRADRSWVLVFLEGAAADPPRPWLRANPRISQSGRRFEPRVLPVTVGTEVEFPNDDTIFHNVFSLSKAAPFDLGVYEPGQTASVQMQRTGLVKVYCNIHPEMSASIVVLDNSWFALTEPSGAFVIPGVPDGVYTLRGWNDMGAEARAPLEVRGARMFEARLELRETRRTIAHTNKFGGPYTGKYR